MIKNILCFGDSNTWGLNPQTGKRFSATVRWPAKLAVKLGANFTIIEAGQPNRALVNNPPFAGELSGVTYLQSYLNELEIDSILNFYEQSNAPGSPKILILSPAHVREVGSYAGVYKGAEQKVVQLAAAFANVASIKQCSFYDLARIVSVSNEDGVHLDEKQHQKISDALETIIREF
ncbi:hypothetical protein [Pseudoalteromonas nigrifaciens]|uniref:hypothetical protein n=1 Tax=Pseudoalteromonas nigrifaciens TaxID=28109 RepID=UPI003F99F0AB